MKVFVSYRRSDSQDIAARVVDRLKETPGINRVFFDVDSISPGADFSESIKSSLAQCDICLILIGSNWRGTSKEGTPRIDNEADFVRQETAVALASGKRVLPVLLNNADMPEADLLPPDSRAIATLNASFLRHQSFNQDLELLVDAMFGRKTSGRVSSFFRRHPVLFGVVKSAVGMVAAAAALVVIAIVHKSVTGNAINQSVGDGIAWLLILAVLLAGAALPIVKRR